MLKAFLYSLGVRLSVPILGALNLIFLVRVFDKSQVGEWVLYMSIASLIEIVKNGLIKNSTVRKINLEAASFFINICFSITVSACLVIANVWLKTVEGKEVFANILLIHSIQCLVLIPFHHVEYVLSAKIRFKKLMRAFFIRGLGVFLTLLVLFFSHTNASLETLAIGQTLGLIAGTVFLCKGDFTWPDFLNAQREKTWALIHYGKYVFATNVSSTLFRSTDTYMLAALIGNVSVASYNIAIRVTNLMDLPSSALGEVLFPHSVKRFKLEGKDALRGIYEISVGYTLAIAIPVTMIVYWLSEWIVQVLAGKEYLDSVPILRVTLLMALLLPFLKQFGTVIDALNMPQKNFKLMLLGFLLNVIVNYLFITKLGTIGAAYATFLVYIVLVFTSQGILYRELNVSIFGVLRNVPGAYVELWKMVRKRLK